MPEGYPRLASLMGAHSEVAIFRRFSSLNALNLLYMQAELTDLELGLQRQAKIDAESGQFERSLYARDWQTLSGSTSAGDGSPIQWNTMMQIREKLDKYNKTLWLQHIIAKMASPKAFELKFLRSWMEEPSMGNVYLLGSDSDTWERFDPSELVSLQARDNSNWFTGFLMGMPLQWYHYTVGFMFKVYRQFHRSNRVTKEWRGVSVTFMLKVLKKPDSSEMHNNTVHYTENTFVRLGLVAGTTIASLLPVGSIVVLYFVVQMTTRLVIIGAFTATFSLGLGLFTSARTIEIFSVTSAFAAVQVVFVGSTGTPQGA